MKKLTIVLLFCCIVVCLAMASCNLVSSQKYTAEDIGYISNAGDHIVYLTEPNKYYDYYKAYDEPAAAGIVTVDDCTGPILVSEVQTAVAFYRSDNKKDIVTFGGSVDYNGITYYYSAAKNFVQGSYSGKSKAKLFYCTATTMEEAAKEMLAIADIDRIAMATVSDETQLRQLENSAKTVKLTHDIDLNGKEWTPIEGFAGKLYGNGHIIIGLSINEKNKANLGLFGTLSGRVENLSVTDASVTATGDVGVAGIVAGVNKGVIDNVTVTGSITFGYYNSVGGIAGYNDGGKILNCTNKATVSAANNVGGIVGYSLIRGSNVLDGNVNLGTITGKDNVGGVCGYLYAKLAQSNKDEESSVSDCNNSGTVSGVNSVGGVFGRAEGQTYTFSGTLGGLGGYSSSHRINGTLLNNSGTVTGSASGSATGGVIGWASNIQKLTASNNSADIVGGFYVGGIVGNGTNSTIIADKENTNAISGKAYIGGIAGRAGVVENAVNSGEITASGAYVEKDIVGAYLGGVAGLCNGIINCVNKADITYSFTGNYVGGVAGFVNVTGNDRLNDNVNDGKVSSTAGCVGGIAGYVTCPSYSSTDKRNYSMGYNTNNGEITGVNNVGGVFGRMYASVNEYWMSSYYNTFTISYCVNTAVVDGTNKVGGVVGSYYNLKTDDATFETNTTTHGNVLGG